jgi:hypothetical protein
MPEADVKRHFRLIALSGLLLCPMLVAQDAAPRSLRDTAIAEARGDAPRDLKVIAPTLAAEQIDRAVLNRLLQEINTNPELTATRLGLDQIALQDVAVALSNAHGFINDNEMANIRAMCNSWKTSDLEGEARVQAALAAYKRRQQFTLNFIERYYAFVLEQIRANLPATAIPQFDNYLDDRRRRMANAGTTVLGAVVQNADSGADSIRLNCRADID